MAGLGHRLESSHLHQSEVVDYFNAGVVVPAEPTGNQLPSMAIDYAMALLDGELGVEFELGQQYFIDSNFIIEGKHEAVSIGVDGAAKNGFLFVMLFFSDKLCA